MPSPSLDQLKRAIAVKEQIQKLETELAGILGGSEAPAAPAAKRKYTKKSAASSDAPAAAPAAKSGKAKRTMSAEGRARIIAAQKARWAKVKKSKA